MNHEVICTWLNLPPGNWPPDHYTLLGLPREDAEPARVEQRVHDHLARVRCYQISHPEEATEVMNRLAQAFMCLTDPGAKQAYDASLSTTDAVAAPVAGAPGKAAAVVVAVGRLPGKGPSDTTPIPPTRVVALAPALLDTAVGSAPVTQVDWKATVAPPPVRVGAAADADPAVAPEGAPAAEAPPGPAAPAALAPTPQVSPQPVASGPLAGYKGFSAAILQQLTSRRGLGTRQELYKRVRRTRCLLHAWALAGKYLGKPKRLLKGPAEERELSRALAAIADHSRCFPRLLAHPGLPGYRVAARARVPLVADHFNTLDAAQRDLLAQDWAAGQTLLSAHRQFLRQELRAVHDLSWSQLCVRAFLCDFPVKTVLVLVLLVVALIVFHAVAP
jgi:hypothetical protein